MRCPRGADNPEEDPNLEDGEDSEIEDYEIKESDLVVLAARNEDEVAHIEVYVYEEADDDGETNLYVHHDIMLPAFPLRCHGRLLLRSATAGSDLATSSAAPVWIDVHRLLPCGWTCSSSASFW